MDQSGALDTAKNMMTEKTHDEDSYTDDDEYVEPSNAGKSALSLAGAEKIAQE